MPRVQRPSRKPRVLGLEERFAVGIPKDPSPLVNGSVARRSVRAWDPTGLFGRVAFTRVSTARTLEKAKAKIAFAGIAIIAVELLLNCALRLLLWRIPPRRFRSTRLASMTIRHSNRYLRG